MRGTSVLAGARASIAALAFVAASTWWPGVALSAAKRTNMTPFAYDTSGIVGIGADPASVVGPAVLQFQGLGGASYDPATGQPIPLGQFVANPGAPTNGLGTIYNGTPFEVEIQAPGLDKTSSFPLLGKLFPGLGKGLSLKTVNENSVILKGTLTGTVSGSGRVDVTATVGSVKLGSLDAPTQDHITHYTFPIRFSQLKLPAGWAMAGTTVPTGSTLTLTPGATPTTLAHTPATAVAAPQFIGGATAQTPSPSATSALTAPAAVSGTVAIPIPTPEPSTILVFATAFGGLALARRRRRAR